MNNVLRVFVLIYLVGSILICLLRPKRKMIFSKRHFFRVAMALCLVADTLIGYSSAKSGNYKLMPPCVYALYFFSTILIIDLCIELIQEVIARIQD